MRVLPDRWPEPQALVALLVTMPAWLADLDLAVSIWLLVKAAAKVVVMVGMVVAVMAAAERLPAEPCMGIATFKVSRKAVISTIPIRIGSLFVQGLSPAFRRPTKLTLPQPHSMTDLASLAQKPLGLPCRQPLLRCHSQVHSLRCLPLRQGK